LRSRALAPPRYFKTNVAGELNELVKVANVTVFLFGEETDCTFSPLINVIASWFDPSFGCEESWLQLAQLLENDGEENLLVPERTLEGKKLSDFDEIYASIVGVDNSNVFARNKGSFKVFDGCPAEDRYLVTFHLEGQSSLDNYYSTGNNLCVNCIDSQTGWYVRAKRAQRIARKNRLRQRRVALGAGGGARERSECEASAKEVLVCGGSGHARALEGARAKRVRRRCSSAAEAGKRGSWWGQRSECVIEVSSSAAEGQAREMSGGDPPTMKPFARGPQSSLGRCRRRRPPDHETLRTRPPELARFMWPELACRAPSPPPPSH
jgi:hypothetical protein